MFLDYDVNLDDVLIIFGGFFVNNLFLCNCINFLDLVVCFVRSKFFKVLLLF